MYKAGHTQHADIIFCTCMIGNRTVESRGSFSSLNKQKDMGICLAGNGLIVFTIIYEVYFFTIVSFLSCNVELLYAHVLYLSLIVNN